MNIWSVLINCPRTLNNKLIIKFQKVLYNSAFCLIVTNFENYTYSTWI